MVTDARLQFSYKGGGTSTFSRINPQAPYSKLLELAGLINGLQADGAERVLLVSVREH